MPYTVEITTPPVQRDGEDQAARMYQLPEPFGTVAEAKEAAVTHIAGLGINPACAVYNVFDREGFTVASNADLPAEADQVGSPERNGIAATQFPVSNQEEPS